MKAIAVRPGIPGSVHLTQLEKPSIKDVPQGRGVLIEILRVGVDGTDKEINAAEYGAAPPGYDFLVIGHESFGRVVEIGPNVTALGPGDYVTATVRRPGTSLYDQIGHYDMTMDDTYYERGINLLHGFLTEHIVDDPEYLVKVPPGLRHAGVLMEPMSVIEKGIAQTFEIQRRLRLWRPRRAAVMGSGAIGLLAALALRLRGLDVTVFSRTRPPSFKSNLVEKIGARYLSTETLALKDAAREFGPFDIIFEATGSSRVAFESMEILNKNGVLILTSITGGKTSLEIPADEINLRFVLDNKVMFGTVNANREYFELGVKDFAHAESEYPGWLASLLTNPIQGLDQYDEMMRQLTEDRHAVKVYVEVKPLD
ncbi:MAG TPA: glucose 1-dehydrogenase [Planctomycetota bacterium]|nr:glucose 1-dehydrogenase [Planctomycetota bacterium]